MAANPHCPSNMFLRRRALVIPKGPSGLPEAMVLLRTSVQVGGFEGPVVAACRARMRGPESGFVILLYGTPKNPSSKHRLYSKLEVKNDHYEPRIITRRIQNSSNGKDERSAGNYKFNRFGWS